MRTKYVLTYDLKILYCQDIDLNLSCKELDLSNLQFHLYDGSKEDLNYGFELNPNEVNVIASEILMGKVGYILSDKNMLWLEKFEEMLKRDMTLLLNKKVSYTYFILKLQLLGFGEDIAKDIVMNYYYSLERGEKVAHPQVFLKNINRLLKQKIFWVPMNFDKEEILEYKFLQEIIETKQDMMYKFSFDQMYRDRYMDICKKGIVHKLLEFNTHPSYMVRKKQNISNLVPFTIQEYNKLIKKMMINIYNKKYLNVNTGFIQDTLKHMEVIIRLYISLNFK